MTKSQSHRRKASIGGGFVNEAFADYDDDDVERRMSYASWMNQAQAETSVDYVDLSFNRDSASASVISELDQKLKSKKKKKCIKCETMGISYYMLLQNLKRRAESNLEINLPLFPRSISAKNSTPFPS